MATNLATYTLISATSALPGGLGDLNLSIFWLDPFCYSTCRPTLRYIAFSVILTIFFLLSLQFSSFFPFHWSSPLFKMPKAYIPDSTSHQRLAGLPVDQSYKSALTNAIKSKDMNSVESSLT